MTRLSDQLDLAFHLGWQSVRPQSCLEESWATTALVKRAATTKPSSASGRRQFGHGHISREIGQRPWTRSRPYRADPEDYDECLGPPAEPARWGRCHTVSHLGNRAVGTGAVRKKRSLIREKRKHYARIIRAQPDHPWQRLAVWTSTALLSGRCTAATAPPGESARRHREGRWHPRELAKDQPRPTPAGRTAGHLCYNNLALSSWKRRREGEAVEAFERQRTSARPAPAAMETQEQCRGWAWRRVREL